jgi:hypothetical protein
MLYCYRFTEGCIALNLALKPQEASLLFDQEGCEFDPNYAQYSRSIRPTLKLFVYF